MARLPNFLVIIRSEKLSGKGQGRGCLGVRKKERFVLGKRTFRSQKSKHFVLRIIQVVIPTALAEKTFLEKAFLLHELFSSQTSREANRKSRHLYDLAQMMSTDIATRAIANDELWNTIHHHRELFTSMSGVDYTPDIRKRIRLLPPDDVMDDWYNDYKDMQSSMIYGEKPSFEELIEKMRELENLFHNTKH